MKKAFYLISFWTIASCGSSSSEMETTKAEECGLTTLKIETIVSTEEHSSSEPSPINKESLNFEFEQATLFNLLDTITADLNGDGNDDQAFFKKEKKTSGIIIKHGQTGEVFSIGFGKHFAHLTDFNWVDYWGLIHDSKAVEIVVENAEIIGDRIVILVNPSIVVRRVEEGGGLITFKNGGYEWIHQAH